MILLWKKTADRSVAFDSRITDLNLYIKKLGLDYLNREEPLKYDMDSYIKKLGLQFASSEPSEVSQEVKGEQVKDAYSKLLAESKAKTTKRELEQQKEKEKLAQEQQERERLQIEEAKQREIRRVQRLKQREQKQTDQQRQELLSKARRYDDYYKEIAGILGIPAGEELSPHLEDLSLDALTSLEARQAELFQYF